MSTYRPHASCLFPKQIAPRFTSVPRRVQQKPGSVRRAVLFLYLNRYGYNGLCRYNLRGEFNVPFGRYKKPYFPEAELYHFAEKAQNAFFYCESYADSMARADDASVVYWRSALCTAVCDRQLYGVSHKSFTLEQQAHLAEIAEGLVERHIPVLISNHDTMLTREWYQRANCMSSKFDAV